MLEVVMSEKFPISARAAWDVVGRFNELQRWQPSVVSCELVAAPGGLARRVCRRFADGTEGDLLEQLVFYDCLRREYAYAITEGETPYSGFLGRVCVRPEGLQQCAVRLEARFQPAVERTRIDAIRWTQENLIEVLASLKRMF